MIPPNQIRILYAESDPDASFMMSTLLKLSGMQTVIAPTVKAALQKARAERFDVYMLDGGFEDGSGLELCRTLREFDPQTPIAFYSGWAYASDIQSGLEAGARAYLVKPGIDTVVPELLRLAAQSSTQQDRAASEPAFMSAA